MPKTREDAVQLLAGREMIKVKNDQEALLSPLLRKTIWFH